MERRTCRKLKGILRGCYLRSAPNGCQTAGKLANDLPMTFALKLSLTFTAVTIAVGATAADFRVASLRCEYAESPLGVDVAAPRLFWKLESRARSARQTAYQVLVASRRETLASGTGDLWDSGKVNSDESTQISYGGKPLRSSQQVFWKVRAWNEDDKYSDWSQAATWTMGVLSETDWRAQWVGGPSNSAPQSLCLRREFVVKPHLRRALIQICGLGCYELSLNGRKVGDALFPSGWTKYDRTCLYDTYDVTPLLRAGPNAVGLLLGNGMYNVVGGRYTKFTGSFGPLKALVQLRLEYADGSIEVIGTDESWRRAPGPITFSCVFGGEDYDARLELRDWSRPGFNDAKWEPAVPTRGPGGKLKGFSCAAPEIRAFEVLKPVKAVELRPGVTVYDLGQNASLMPRIVVHGPAGAVVRLVPAELLKSDRSVDRGSCGGGAAYWQYTLRGGGKEHWFPKFFYHGCRYLQVERQSPAGGKLPELDSLEGVVVHSSAEPVGQFECSNDLFNRVHRLIRWAQRSNMMSVMTDCPHREKLGWLEEDHLNGPSLRYEFGLSQLFTKMMNDMADSQLENGLVPDIAPEYVKFGGGFRDSPEWGSACILVPWQQYEFDGDVELLRRHYDVMAQYVAYLGSRATNHIVSHGLGDWYDIGPKPPGVAQLTPLALTATGFYYYDTWVLARTAALLGKADDARKYDALAGQIRDAFNQTFFDPVRRQYATGSQCANSIALVMGLVQGSERAAVLDAVVNDVHSRGNALTTGDVGYRYLLRALADGGRSDVIFDMNNQAEKPGYGYQLKQGATSLAEAWDAGRHSSQNHFMLGQIMEWFYCDLAGISCDPTGPGFKRIIIKPALVGDLAWVKAAYNSIHGQIVCRWNRKGDQLRLQVTIPANATATVFMPAASADTVTAQRAPAAEAKGVSFLRSEPGCAVYAVGSGAYEFRSILPVGAGRGR